MTNMTVKTPKQAFLGLKSPTIHVPQFGMGHAGTERSFVLNAELGISHKIGTHMWGRNA
jgi:hypothetical protein